MHISPEEKHRNKVREEVEKRQLSSIMNRTKWLEFQTAMYDELPFPPAYSRKDVLDIGYEPFTEDAWYLGDYEEGLQPFYSIEWIEVRPRIIKSQGRLVKGKVECIEEKFISILKKYNIPYKDNNGSYLIYGYVSDFTGIVVHNA